MIRPKSVIQFERCYIAAFLLGLVNTGLSWAATTQAQFQATRWGYLLAGTLVGFALTAAIWYFVARRGSVIAKWIAVIFVILGVVGLVGGVIVGTYPKNLAGVIGVTTTILQAVAVWMLFQTDTKAWFGGGPAVNIGETIV